MHELHVGDMKYNQLLLAQARPSATSLLKHIDQTAQIGMPPTPTTFYGDKDPPKRGWAHTFWPSSTSKFPSALTLKIDKPNQLDGANADEPSSEPYSIFKLYAIDSIGVTNNNKSDVPVVTDPIRRHANLLNSKNAFSAIKCNARATTKTNTLNLTKVPFIGFFDYDDPSAISTGLNGA